MRETSPSSILGRVDAVRLAALEEAFEAAWSADTSATAAWETSNRAKGQCAVTACVVQDYLGGDILHTTATLPSGELVSHYFNVIDDTPVDFTSKQFPNGTSFSRPSSRTRGYPSTRDYCLSYDSTRHRYDLLSSRVVAYLREREPGS
ncbi:YunG family protein [Nocardia brasiliensis]|uniref:YunG family protein n=1 Tax=Nocardia brasiliensis TaxID=37326 RepID=UPI003D77C9E4